MRHLAKDLEDNLLECFIHHSLANKGRKIIKLKDITAFSNNITKQNKISLLVDGYDEITHLLSSSANSLPNSASMHNHNHNREVSTITEKIKQYPNIIMTSRPGAVSTNLSNHFNQIIKNVGLDDEGINLYIKNYFKQSPSSSVELSQFIDGNKLIKDICQFPINTSMICLIWSRPEMQNNLTADTAITTLYQEILKWLGRRYPCLRMRTRT